MGGFVLRNGENTLGEAAGQPQTDAMSPSSTARFSGRKLRMLLCCAGAPFLIMLDTNIVAVSLPSIARDLRGGFTDVEWVVSAYILPFAALLMPSGALADPDQDAAVEGNFTDRWLPSADSGLIFVLEINGF